MKHRSLFLTGLPLVAFVGSLCSAEIEMRPRPTEEKDFPAYIDYLVEVSYPRSESERAEDTSVMDRYRDAFNLDSLFIGAPGFPAGFTTDQFEDYTGHMVRNRFDALSLTVSNGSDASVEEVFERIKYTSQYLADHSDKYMQITSVDDFATAKRKGLLGIHYNFQSMNALGEDISNIEKYYQLGLRQMNFTYNVDNAFGSGGVSNSDGTDTGVTELGKKAIREMNRLGMVVDASHSSNQTAIDAATISSKPVILSHSNVATFQPIGRNVSDAAIKAVAAGDGVICINFIGGFLNPEGSARPYDIAKHVQYIKNLVGARHVAAGSDYVYNYGDTLLWILRNPKDFPIEMGYATPSHMGMPGEVWGVVRELEDRYDWTEEEIRGFLGENLLRLYRANWK